MQTKKVALITGASRGIGKALAIGLAQLNYQTVLIGRNLKNLEEVASEIESAGGLKPRIFAIDISRVEVVKTTLTKILLEFGRMDVLVNNAGVFFDGTTEIEETQFAKMLDINLTAHFVVVKQIVEVMKRQKSGYIFNIASRSGKVGFEGSGAYSASKFALVGFSESLYRELNPLGIRVTALCPGWVNTNMAVEAGTPLQPNEMIQPEDLFQTLKWLLNLSPGACVKEVILEAPNSIS